MKPRPDFHTSPDTLPAVLARIVLAGSRQRQMTRSSS